MAAAAATFLLRGAAAADGLDRTTLTWRFTVREWLQGPVDPHPQIALVEIDERSLESWKEPIVGWGRHFADALDRLRASGARVVVFDWLQEEPAGEWFPGADARWGEALAQSPRVVMAKAIKPAGGGEAARWIVPTAELLYSLRNQEADLGYVELTTADRAEAVVTAMKPVLRDGDRLEKSLAARALEQYFGAPSRVEGSVWTIPGQARAPLQADGTVLVNYAPRTGSRAFLRLSIHDLVAGPKTGDPRFKDRIVLIGANYVASGDFQYIPVREGWGRQRRLSGVEIHANLLRTLLGRPIREPSPLAAWGMALLLAAVGLAAFYWLPFIRAVLVTLAAAAVWVIVSFALFTAQDYAFPIALPLIGLLTTGGGLGVYRAVREEGERRQVLGLWGRYQDPRLVDYLLLHPDARGGEGREQQVTVLFADLKNFTKTVEHLTPSEALQFLNRYLGLIATVVVEHDGIVDKYLGDGLMAQWGAPEGDPGHAEAAVGACLEIERRVAELTRTVAGASEVTFGLRLTLHTGPAVVGWVGGTRLEFTLIGDTVNVTSRLQETAKELDCEFLISESTYAHVREKVRTGKEAEVEIRGRRQPLRVYEVRGAAAAAEEAASRVIPSDAQPPTGAA